MTLPVESLYERLLIDDEWAVRTPDGFTWWPHRLAQRVHAEAGRGDGTRIHVETDVLRSGGGVLRDSAEAALVELMRHPPMCAFLPLAEDGVVRLWSAVRVSRENEAFALARLATAAALQATYAELGLASLAPATGLAPGTSAHPTSGPRPHPDGLLDLLARRLAPEGQGASRYGNPADWIETQGILEAEGWTALADPRGLTARDGAGVLLEARHGERHPELGSGLFVRLFLPSSLACPSANAALRLNAHERRDEGAAATMGSWCLEESEPAVEFDVRPAPPRLAFVEFLPNALFRPGLVAGCVRGVVERRAASSWP